MVVQRAYDRSLTWAGNARARRLTYLVLALILAVLCLFPRPYLARAKILPQDTSSAAGLGNLMTLIGGQSQSFASLLTGRSSGDLYLVIGRSDSVANRVARDLKLVGPNGYSSEAAAKRYLERKVDITLLLGGIIEIESKTDDPEQSTRLTTAYVDALSKELAAFGEQIIVNKQRIINRRFAAAEQRVAETESALNAFRRANNLAAPEAQLGTELSLRTNLQAELQAKQIELQTLRQFSGPENPQLKSVQSQIASLQEQIRRTAAPATGAAGPNLAGSSQLQNRYLSLFRDYRLAQAIYEVYARSAEQLAVDQLAAETASYVQVIDPAYIDIDRQFNVWAIALLALVVVMAVFTEIYGPYTGLFNLDDLRKSRALA